MAFLAYRFQRTVRVLGYLGTKGLDDISLGETTSSNSYTCMTLFIYMIVFLLYFPQANLRDIFTSLVHGFTQELLEMRRFFESHMDSPPSYPHLPPVANKLLWLRGFKLHIQVNVTQ